MSQYPIGAAASSNPPPNTLIGLVQVASAPAQPSDDYLFEGLPLPTSWAYAAGYTAGVLEYETWTDSASTFLRKRLDYTYNGSGQVATIRTRVYSATNGTTVTRDGTLTYTYSGSEVTSAAMVRTI